MRQGHPVAVNQSLPERGRAPSGDAGESSAHREITYFDRERIPERAVHARGTGAHGWFESFGKIGEEPASKFTRAKVLTQTGVLVDGIDFSDDKMLQGRTFSHSDRRAVLPGHAALPGRHCSTMSFLQGRAVDEFTRL